MTEIPNILHTVKTWYTASIAKEPASWFNTFFVGVCPTAKALSKSPWATSLSSLRVSFTFFVGFRKPSRTTTMVHAPPFHIAILLRTAVRERLKATQSLCITTGSMLTRSKEWMTTEPSMPIRTPSGNAKSGSTSLV
eukprot:Lithocolla_globosa_v1_NODE_7_length_11908_cov_272.203830.p5 type:complete len:137 gc:universal NODE_7_length_11908_cov_272.203830:7099-6689(-)